MLFQRCLDVLFYDIQMVASVVHSNRMLEGMTQVTAVHWSAKNTISFGQQHKYLTSTCHPLVAVCGFVLQPPAATPCT